MVYSLTYRRPPHQPLRPRSSLASEDSDVNGTPESLRSGNSGSSQGIPEALSFDKIVNGGTCPPCTLRDFMNYMLYIEHSAENLKFFLWLRDYTDRFENVKDSERVLSPEWTAAQHEAAHAAAPTKQKGPRKPNGANDIFKGTDFDDSTIKVKEVADPFGTPPRTPRDDSDRRDSERPWDRAQSTNGSETVSAFTGSNTVTHRVMAGEAFESVGLKQPFTIQPFREEINRVISTYIVKAAPCELNLSNRERVVLLTALETTTHPSAFGQVKKTIESSLRRQSHPNFIRWTICNGNRARVIFARGLGISGILGGILFALLFTLSKAGRGWRAFAAIPLLIGISTLVAAYKGMCVVLHGLHHRHLRPWELFDDPESELEQKKDSLDSYFSSNSYEDAPWVVKYEKRNVVRKIFDRELWIEEPALRQIQDTIFLQSVLAAVLFAGVITAIFVAVPKGNYY